MRSGRIGLGVCVGMFLAYTLIAIIGCHQGISEADSHVLAGGNMLDQANYEGALKEFNLALQLNPNDINAFYGRGVAYVRLKDPEHAIPDLNAILKSHPEKELAVEMRGEAYTQLKQYDLAMNDFNQAISLDPNDAEAYRRRAYLYLNKHDYDHAGQDAQRVIDILPDDAKALGASGYIQFRARQYDAAITSFRKELKIDPRDAITANHLGLVYATQGNWNEAKKAYDTALELEDITEQQRALKAIQQTLNEFPDSKTLDKIYDYVAKGLPQDKGTSR